MVTDTYSKMMSDISMRSMLKNNDCGEDMGMLLREPRRQQEVSERDNELNLYRSGSAPPTVEGSLNAVGGLFDASAILGFNQNGGKGFMTEEELRADPAYVNYYYSNVNLNPRLPPPLLSKEDWRFAQRLQGGNGGGGSVVGGIGDRRKITKSSSGDEGVNTHRSLFSVQPGIGGKEENEVELRKGMAEWGGDGLIGLPGLGLASRKKSIAEMIQDDINHAKTHSSQGHPSPTCRNAFGDGVETSEAQFGLLHTDLASVDSLRSSGNKQGMSAVQSIGASASHSYLSALGASLSRSTTPDPQLIARAPSPRIPAAVGRSTSIDKRNVSGQNSFNNISPHFNESEDLVTALSGMNLSTSSMRDEKNHVHPQIRNEINNHNLFNLQGDQNYSKQTSYLNKSDSGNFNLRSLPQSAKGSYQNMGKSNAVGVDLNSYSLMSKEHLELKKSANSYIRGPSTPTLTGRGNSYSQYQNVDGTNSLFPNYGVNGYAVSPSSPSFMGSPLGSPSFPPLYESAAAASAMGDTEPGAFGGGLALGPNMLTVAAELQRNQTVGNALQVPLMDPMYLQYLRSSEYAASQAATSNDPSNLYMDLLQKTYLGALFSPQKSQFNLPYNAKAASLNHGYYGNPAFDLGMSYPGSPLASSLLPNSPIGPVSPARHSRFSSGMRNITGLMGGNLDEGFPLSLLDEFKSNKTKCFELSEIVGHVVEFSSDQYGSRFIQQKLETATTEEKNMVFNEIMPQALSLMTDVFGNYVIQKFFEHGTASQIRELADQLAGHVLTLSLQMYGCRVIQKAIEVVDLDQQTKMVTELDGQIMRCVRDQNGNHVIQKCIECVPEDAIQFIVSTFYDQVVTLSTHPYGCRVIQRVLEHCHNPKTLQIMMDEILQSVCLLAQDQYGNYVVQHVMEHGKPQERTAIINKLTGQIVQMSQQKFASNVIEKCLSFGTPAERHAIVNEMLSSTDENDPLQAMMKDQFANYVVQKVLETCDDHQLELILNRIKIHLSALKKYTYGKHIVARVEKLVAAVEKRISVLTPQPASMA